MNELAILRALVGGSGAGSRRPADAPPDDAFREAVQALIAGNAPPGKAAPGEGPDATGADAPDTADGAEKEPAAAEPLPDDPALALFAALTPTVGAHSSVAMGIEDPGPLPTPDMAVASPAREMDAGEMDAAPTKSGAAVPVAPLSPSFRPPAEAAVAPFLAALPADADVAPAPGDAPGRLVATVRSVETHFAPLAPARASIVDPGMDRPGERPEPAAMPAVAAKPGIAKPEIRSVAPPPPDALPSLAVTLEAGSGTPVRPAPLDRPQRAPLSPTAPTRVVENTGPVEAPIAATDDGPPPAKRVEPLPGLAGDAVASPRLPDHDESRPVSADATAQLLPKPELPRIAASLSEALRAPVATPLAPSPAAQAGPLRVVSLTLDPEHLGRVTLTIRLANERLSLHVAADRPETAEMIEKDADVIAQLLGGEGVEVDTLTATALGAPVAPPPVAAPLGPAPQLAGTGFAEGQSSPQHAPRDERRPPANQSSHDPGSRSHEEADDQGRTGRLYV